jgi:hypothetical protein
VQSSAALKPKGHTIAQVVCQWPLTMEVWCRSQASSCDIFDVQSGIETGFPKILLVLPVSMIPSVFHTHFLLIYHLCYIITPTVGIIKYTHPPIPMLSQDWYSFQLNCIYAGSVIVSLHFKHNALHSTDPQDMHHQWHLLPSFESFHPFIKCVQFF